MAKKKAGTSKMPATAEPEVKTKPVRLDLTPELHQRLRVVSAEQGKPMAVFAREIVEKAVNELYAKR
jgi:predicted DNA-binding protein